MKVLQIRLKNLNSLTGEWSVDFTDPAFAAEGIFAITGPTGAGKSTLLDAVCLALFGQTPRLGKVTKAANEIMSRHTGECFAEVTFSTAKGRYCCHWSQHRARRKPGGELQQPRHEIADAETGTPLEVGHRSVLEAVEKAAGMDFDRFTRSMLLAQGGFAAFLQADADGRSPILEQITGTEVYSQLSRAVHERWNEEKLRFDSLEKELGGFQPLTADQEAALRERLSETQRTAQTLEGKLSGLREDLAWIDKVVSLEAEVAALVGRRSAAQAQRAAFQPERDRLERARRTLRLAGPAAALAALETEQSRGREKLSNARLDIPALDAAQGKARQVEAEALARLEEARQRQEQEKPLARAARELDLKLVEAEKQLRAAAEELRQAEIERSAAEKRRQASERERDQATANLARQEAELVARAADAALVENLAAIRRLFATLDEGEKKHRAAMLQSAAATEGRLAAERDWAKARGVQEEARAALHSAEDAREQWTEALAKTLGGKEAADWRAEQESARDRLRRLEEAVTETSQLHGLQQRLAQAEKLGQTQGETLCRLAAALDQAGRELAAAEAEAGRLEERAALLNRIRDLEAERARLVDGAPCPLCGAREHPYAVDKPALPDETEAQLRQTRARLRELSERLAADRAARARAEAEHAQAEKVVETTQAEIERLSRRYNARLAELGLDCPLPSAEERLKAAADVAGQSAAVAKDVLDQVAKLEKRLKEAVLARDKAAQQAAAAERAEADGRHRMETAVELAERRDREAREAAVAMAAAREEAMEEVRRFGVTVIPLDGTADVLAGLSARKDRWQTLRDEKEALAAKAETLTSDLRVLAERLDSADREGGSKRARQAACQATAASWRSERRAGYGDRDPDAEEKRFAVAAEHAEKALASARAGREKAEKAAAARRETIVALEQEENGRTEQIAAARQEFAALCRDADFLDEADYQAAVMPPGEREALERREEDLRQTETRLATLLADKAGALAAERGRARTTTPREVLEQQRAAEEAALREAREEAGRCDQQLKADQALRQRVQAALTALAGQRREWERWDRLRDLIGSADGKKFRNFAQGLTFEILVAHANEQLKKLSDRYVLTRREDQPLELSVVDSYQAGEVRSTQNLSGGESFLVSLALALGLSSMASRNVPVDSLFLDEGFGTLDEDALETALETLAELRQDNKLIGVISHVGALKERIATRIQVVPQRGGRSTLEGPGCRFSREG